MKKTIIYIFIVLSFGIGIRIVLSNSYEINQHNIGTQGNQVYISNDGHQEAVFDYEGNPVTDIINMASYNFRSPINEPYGHFMLDTLPWVFLGNSPDDPTSIFTRLSAFGLDLWGGLLRSLFTALFFLIFIPLILFGIAKYKPKKNHT